MTVVRFISGLAFVAALHSIVVIPELLAGQAVQPDSVAADKPARNKAVAWLGRMNAALNQLDYQGTIVYVESDDVQTMRITHITDEFGERERLVSQTGSQHEILRDSNGVSWVLEDNRQVMEDASSSQSFFSQFSSTNAEDLRKHYDLKLGETQRVAGRKTRSLKILPRDNYRYGYVLWLEVNSGLLLKWELFDEQRKSLAKLMFTDIRLGSEVDHDELVPNRGRIEYGTVAADLPDSQSLNQSSPKWKAARLPPGFELTTHRRLDQSENETFEHHVYSDGFATVSVYVESEVGKAAPPIGLSRLGTTHAYSRQDPDVTITVIGDVPAVTVKLIGSAIQLQ
jgi:sigma-E factor negative regulatory protein RseB